MSTPALIQDSTPFLSWLADWHARLPEPALDHVVGDPRRAAILVVDVINAFGHIGPLASPRITGIIGPIARLMSAAHHAGVQQFISIQEGHDPEAVEFDAYPPHGIRGSEESEAVPELKALPFWSEVTLMRKNSISCSIGTALDAWLETHPEVNTFIAVGDCTDICTYQLAIHLRARANAFQQRGVRVIVPEDCSDTFDTPVDVAQRIGAMPHAADLLHQVFLYHMALNGVEVVKRIAIRETERVETAAQA